MLRQANLVTAVSEGILADLPLDLRQGHVLYNGVSLPGPPLEQEAMVLPKGSLLVYTGSLYGPNRDPRPAMRAVASLADEGWRLVYAGKDGALWGEYVKETGAEGVAHTLGLVTPQQALELQSLANVNLLLTWGNDGQTGGMTMKVFEYLQAGRPILRVHDGPNDPEIDALLDRGAAVAKTVASTHADLGSIADWLRRLPAPDGVGAGSRDGSGDWSLAGRLDEFYESHFAGQGL